MMDKIKDAQSTTDLNLMRKYLDDKDENVREALALNRALPVELLVILSSDESSKVRFAVKSNDNYPSV